MIMLFISDKSGQTVIGAKPKEEGFVGARRELRRLLVVLASFGLPYLFWGCAAFAPTPPPPPPTCNGNPTWCITVVDEGTNVGMMGAINFNVDGTPTNVPSGGKVVVPVTPGQHIINLCTQVWRGGIFTGNFVNHCTTPKNVDIESNRNEVSYPLNQ
jgi:hypothetical protein